MAAAESASAVARPAGKAPFGMYFQSSSTAPKRSPDADLQLRLDMHLMGCLLVKRPHWETIASWY